MGIDYAAMTTKAAQMLKDSQAAAGITDEAAAGGVKRPADSPADGAPAPKVAAPPATPKTEEGQLPAGWARAKDAQGRTYFWHTQVRCTCIQDNTVLPAPSAPHMTMLHASRLHCVSDQCGCAAMHLAVLHWICARPGTFAHTLTSATAKVLFHVPDGASS